VTELNDSLDMDSVPSHDLRWPSVHTMNPAEALGQISWLWQRSPMHRAWSVGLMGHLVRPALQHRQFALAQHRDGTPVFYASWALIDDEREQRLMRNANALSAADWNCGDHVWIIDWIAPFGGTRQFHRKFRAEVFPGKVVWALRASAGRKKLWVQQSYGVGVSMADRKLHWQRIYRNHAAEAKAP
jgi:cytolysin-activating lysine-acyltransferase